MLTGLNMSLMAHASGQSLIDVRIPPLVLDEVVAAHARASEESETAVKRIQRQRKRLGLPRLVETAEPGSYREYLETRLDEHLGFGPLSWPSIDHKSLVERAIGRTPPFDAHGGGYRDSLIWTSVLELAREGHHVVLVSGDRAFSGSGESLHPVLQEEVAPLAGTVELVRDLSMWLLQTLPWKSDTLKGVLALARDEDFLDYFLNSDMQGDLVPDTEAMGFDEAPFEFDATEITWAGTTTRVSSRRRDDGATLVEYDIDQEIAFEASLPEKYVAPPSWEKAVAGGRLFVRGQVGMVVRVAVLFDNEQGMAFESVSWRRSDGTPAGPGIEPALTGTPLFDL